MNSELTMMDRGRWSARSPIAAWLATSDRDLAMVAWACDPAPRDRPAAQATAGHVVGCGTDGRDRAVRATIVRREPPRAAILGGAAPAGRPHQRYDSHHIDGSIMLRAHRIAPSRIQRDPAALRCAARYPIESEHPGWSIKKYVVRSLYDLISTSNDVVDRYYSVVKIQYG